MSGLEIVSDGTATGTVIRTKNGEVIHGVTSIEFYPICVGGTVQARITVDRIALQIGLNSPDIVCTDIVTEERIKDAIERIGSSIHAMRG